MLNAWKNQVKQDGILFVSTPVFNGSAAANHINEMGRVTLGKAFEMAGFEIIGNYGTFASISDYQHMMSKEQLGIFERLRDYYDTNVLATIFAPLFPAGSRNNLWVLRNRWTPANSDVFLDAELDANQNPDIKELFTGKKEEDSAE